MKYSILVYIMQLESMKVAADLGSSKFLQPLVIL